MVREKFEELGRRVWSRIRLSEQLGVRQGEETITDDLLLDIAEQRYPNIRVVQTPNDREPLMGTDGKWYVCANRFG